ncbi:armadillo repeat-containing protein 8 [Marchantia polymorpha subsp. ruderalis]
MPASAAWARPEELVESLSSLDNTARLKALRDVKNQIIGNKTKKLSYIKLGAVPRVVEILASDTEVPLLVQSAAAVGSFACGIEAGVKAVLDSGVLPHLLKMLSNGDNKVVEACARSLKMIFQSTLAPKSDMFQGHRMELIIELLNSENDSVAEVAASVLARCCETVDHQRALADAGGLQSLVGLLNGSLKTREAALDALAALTRGNKQLCSTLTCMDQGKSLAMIMKLVKDKSSRTRLLACTCLANIGKASPSSLHQEREIRAGMLSILVKLFDEPGQVGEEAPGVLADLVSNNEDLQKVAMDMNSIEKLAEFLRKDEISPKQLAGVLMALAELCSRFEDSRKQLLDLKNLRTGLTDELLVLPLLKLLSDSSSDIQALALSAVSNIVLDFKPHKAVVFRCGGVSQLIQLSQSMDPILRLNAVWALKNLLYMSDKTVKERVMGELTFNSLVDLIFDSEEKVREQAMALVRNLVYGDVDSVQLALVQDSVLLHAVEKQLHVSTQPEICIQGLYIVSNVAAGNEVHKEAVMDIVIPVTSVGVNRNTSLLMRYLQDMSNPQIRVVALWCVINLTFPNSPGVSSRISRLRDGGIEAQLQSMVDDPCLDVKDRAKTALEQFSAVEVHSR